MKRKFTNKLKQLISLFLVVIMLAGCSCSNNKADNNGEKDTNEEETRKVINANNSKPIKSEPVNYNLEINDDTSILDESYDISEILYGIFFEDINYAIDGGLYAEMVKNRSFEYSSIAQDGNKNGWGTGDNVNFTVVDGSTDGTCLNENNPSYAVIENTVSGFAGIRNRGFLDGMAVKKDAKYRFSAFIKGLDGYTGPVKVMLTDSNDYGKVYGEAVIDKISNQWWKYTVEFTATETVSSEVRLQVMIEKGKAAFDMVSLFPEDTYKNRENGLRKDIVEYLEALSPKFIRFPGGCVVEGKSYESQYNWKDSIGNGLEFTINGQKTVGDVAARPLAIDIWADLNGQANTPYYMTYGVGFYEYFLLCEDLDALPIPILNAGMTCPIQSGNSYHYYSISSDEFKQYVQDALDLVEFCRGDATTKWGAVRIAMGHSEPFELKYIGIGNEQWQEEYYQHYMEFVKAFKQAAIDKPEMYGDIELIVANGPVSGDRYGWNKVNANGGLDYAALVDEHYYQTPSWFLANTERYDAYKRGTTKVFLGEYAAKSNNWTAALAEAAYMTGLERNGDVVEMACYAPLFGNYTKTQWAPDMIWFTNDSVHGSVNYYIQKMFADNAGTTLLKTTFETDSDSSGGLKGMAGVGTWSTSAAFDDIKIVSNKDDSVLYEQSFDDKDAIKEGKVVTGKFSIKDGKLVQSYTGNTANETTGDVIYFGDTAFTDYTFTCTATKTGGAEGFLIPIAVQDENNNIFWNIGGWGNTVSCLQFVSDGSKSDQVEGTVTDIALTTNKEYKIKVVVSGNNIKCYLNNINVIDYDYNATGSVYQVTSTDETGDIIIKLVNVSGEASDINISIPNIDAYNTTADVTKMEGANGNVTNTEDKPDNLVPSDDTTAVDKEFTYTLPKYSVHIIRIHKK